MRKRTKTKPTTEVESACANPQDAETGPYPTTTKTTMMNGEKVKTKTKTKRRRMERSKRSIRRLCRLQSEYGANACANGACGLALRALEHGQRAVG